MNSKALSLGGISLALAVLSYFVLNTLYPFTQTQEVLKPPVTAEQVFAGKLNDGPSPEKAATP